jgi:hypothetical protein
MLTRVFAKERCCGVCLLLPRTPEWVFCAATETALEMATIKARLLVNMDVYDQLLAQKRRAAQRSAPAAAANDNPGL